jgi:hypothetical protein
MTAKINWLEDGEVIKNLSMGGMTCDDIGRIYNVCRASISFGLKKYYPELSLIKTGKSLSVEAVKAERISRMFQKSGRITGRHQDALSKAHSKFFTTKKNNAKYGKWKWDISIHDIEFPVVCPMLGIVINWFSVGGRDESSPSLDRLNSSIGYVKGNVVVCSWRANRLKNNGTAAELRRIADFLDNL